MRFDEFFKRIKQQNAERPGTHTLHPGLTDEERDAWQAEHRGIRLPDDLLALLRRSNGLGLHQEWFDGEPVYDEGAYRFFPLKEIKPVDEAMYGQSVDDSRICRNWWVFCIGPDSSVYFGFDTDTLHFWKLEPILPDESEGLGSEIRAILEIVIA